MFRAESRGFLIVLKKIQRIREFDYRGTCRCGDGSGGAGILGRQEEEEAVIEEGIPRYVRGSWEWMSTIWMATKRTPLFIPIHVYFPSHGFTARAVIELAGPNSPFIARVKRFDLQFRRA